MQLETKINVITSICCLIDLGLLIILPKYLFFPICLLTLVLIIGWEILIPKLIKHNNE